MNLEQCQKMCDALNSINTRGGARKGAGRKPRTIPRKSITVRLEPQDADRLRELCRSEEMSQANWIAKQIRVSH